MRRILIPLLLATFALTASPAFAQCGNGGLFRGGLFAGFRARRVEARATRAYVAAGAAGACSAPSYGACGAPQAVSACGSTAYGWSYHAAYQAPARAYAAPAYSDGGYVNPGLPGHYPPSSGAADHHAPPPPVPMPPPAPQVRR